MRLIKTVRTFTPLFLAVALFANLAFFVVDQAAADPLAISDLRITNVRDQAATISWLTRNESLTGRVLYGTDPTNLNFLAYDDRGETATAQNHYVTLTELVHNTTYYYEVQSGSHSTTGSLTTAPTLPPPAPSGVSYGRIFYADGITPAPGTIVYLTIRDADGSSPDTLGDSAPLSALVESSGYWSYSFSNARTQDLQGYFTISPTGDQVLAEPIGPNGEPGEPLPSNYIAIWDTGNLAPAPDFFFPPSLATNIAFFDATPTEEAISITWATVSEEELEGFNLWRNTDSTAPVDQLNTELIAAQNAGSPQGASYEWTDSDVEQGITYYYWLEVVEADGSTSFVGPVSAAIDEPLAVQLTDIVTTATQLPWQTSLLTAGLIVMLGWLGFRRRRAA